MTGWTTISISLVFSAFFSGMEIAFVSANRLKVELEMKKKSTRSKVLNVFFKNPSRFIGALLLGNNIALVIYGIAMAKALEPLLIAWFPVVAQTGLSIVLIQTLISTFLILIVAEYIPKVVFRINPNGLLNSFTYPTGFLYFLLYPLIIIYIGISEIILKKLFRLKLERDTYKFSTIDLNEYIKDYAPNEESSDDINPDIQILQNAMEFRHIKLRECMVPRTEIEAINIDNDMSALLEKFADTKHSKILVYQGSLDNIIGYVHSYDLFKRPSTIAEVLRKIDIYPETFAASRLLTRFAQSRQGIALVVDEFGGTSGIVSMEDVIEEIFGEIEDEFDEEETVEQQLSDSEFLFSTRLEIDYLNNEYNLHLPESEDYETLAGFIIHYHESIPVMNEVIFIEPYHFTVVKATDNKVLEVKLRLIE